MGDNDAAIKYYQEALVLAREIGNRWQVGAFLGNLGIAYKEVGDLKKAIEYHEEALITNREIGDKQGEGNALANLGNISYEKGDTYSAIENMKEALSIYEAIESPHVDWARSILMQWTSKG